MKFYIASKLENAEIVKRVAEVLKAAGHEHTYDWTVHGSVQSEGPARLSEVADCERNGVATADIVIVILPGGRGTHTELGIALGQKYPPRIIICAENDDLFQQDERTCAFYWNSGIVRVTGQIDDWLREIFRLITPQTFSHN